MVLPIVSLIEIFFYYKQAGGIFMRTTININRELSKKIKTAADKLQISKNDFISLLINIAISKKAFTLQSLKCVTYQNPDPDKNWVKLHVTFDNDTYEKGLDCRKFFKVSVSLLISFAFINYYDEIISSYQNKCDLMDNYPRNYILITKLFNSIQGFIILWGYPGVEHLENLLPQQK
jgi:hypothetical protein